LVKFEEILAIDEKISEAHLRKADCLDLLGDIPGSIKSYSDAIETDPQNKIAYYNRALSYEKISDFKKASHDYLQAVTIDPNNKSDPDNKITYHNLGILYGQSNQLDKAIEAFTKAIEIDNNYADAYHNRGYAYQLKGDYDSAIKEYDKAIQIDPSNEGYKFSKGRLLQSRD